MNAHQIREAVAIVNAVDSSCNTPDGLRDADLQSFLILELTATISRIDAFDHDPDDLEFILNALLAKASVLAARFRMAGELNDIDESISLLEIVAHFPNYNPYQVAPFMFMSAELRYRCTKSADDLDRVIESEEVLLRFEGLRSENVLFILAAHLSIRFKDRHDVADVERLLSLSGEIFPLVSDDSNHLPFWLTTRAVAITHLSHTGRRFLDIRQVFKDVEEGIRVSKDPMASRSLFAFLAEQLKFAALDGDVPQLREIGWIAHSRPEQTRWDLGFVDMFRESTEAELDESIATLRTRCNAADPHDECTPMYTLVLAAALLRRFTGFDRSKYQDLQEAIAFRALYAPYGAFLIDPILLQLTRHEHPAFEERFKTAVITHLEHGNKAWLTSSPKPSTLDQLDQKFWELIDTKNSISPSQRSQDIDSFRLHEPDNCDDLQYLSSQAKRYYSRFSTSSHDLVDLKQAIFYLQKIVDLPHDCRDRDIGFHKYNLAHSLFIVHWNSETLPLHQLLSAFDYLYDVATDRQAQMHLRHQATMLWFMQLHHNSMYDKQKHHISEMCATWLSMVKEHNRLSSNARTILTLQRDAFNQFLPYIIGIVFRACTPSDFELFLNQALQILESGRLFLWEQVRSLHETVGTLPDVNPGLFSRLEETTMALKCHLGIASSPHHGRLGYNSHFAYEERHQIIEEIRSIPGFENALPDNMQLDTDKCETPDGPVVTLLASPLGCAAIVIMTQGCVVTPLSIKFDQLKQLHGSLREFTKSRSGVQCKDSDCSINDDGLPATSTSYHRAGRPRHSPSVQSVDDILECLWDNVAKPVLDAIWDIDVAGVKGKKRAGRKPLLQNRERIWWCCIGEFSFMPIHAAGIYRGSLSTCVSDYFISSYIPTLGALIRAREHPLPTNYKVLAAAQPNPGNNMNKLPSVREELKKILEIVPQDYLIPLDDSEKPDPEGKNATVENVVSRLPEANILHIACHGVQDQKDPLNSGFILAEGKKLTVEEIMKLDLPNAHTAILSACHTASNDTAIPDESINLASALLYAGFSSILGTKWPMADQDGPLIAEEIYKTLFGPPSMELICVSVYQRWVRCNQKEWDRMQQLPSLREVQGTEIDLSAEYQEGVRLQFDISLYQAMNEVSARSLHLLALPEIIDGFARKSRAKGIPASRWATFIHIGV